MHVCMYIDWWFLSLRHYTVEPIKIVDIAGSVEIKNGKIGEGKSASIAVKVEGDNPVYKWFMARNNEVQHLTDNTVFQNTTTATLHIVNATADLVSGEFWCEVSNQISPKETSPSVKLDVSKLIMRFIWLPIL